MSTSITRQTIELDLRSLGISLGDTILIRAGLRNVGRVARSQFLEALLDAVGTEGTVVSLAFTGGSFIWGANQIVPFTLSSPSYAGALPNTMLEHPNAHRSKHPQCSYVAIGKHAESITAGHGPNSGAYEPVRKIMDLNGKVVLVGCVSDSPGFTTAHLAEVDLGLHKRVIMPRLNVAKYYDENGQLKIFMRNDPGLCSNSFWKFYSYYVKHGVLNTGMVGNAYSILARSVQCYEIEREILKNNPQFSICDSPDCITCNVLRWDRLHHIPMFLIRRIFAKKKKHHNKK